MRPGCAQGDAAHQRQPGGDQRGGHAAGHLRRRARLGQGPALGQWRQPWLVLAVRRPAGMSLPYPTLCQTPCDYCFGMPAHSPLFQMSLVCQYVCAGLHLSLAMLQVFWIGSGARTGSALPAGMSACSSTQSPAVLEGPQQGPPQHDCAACAAQEAQYVPGPLLRDGANEVVLLEMEASPDSPRGAPRPRT